MDMEPFREFAGAVALGIEVASVAVISAAAIISVLRMVYLLAKGRGSEASRSVFLHLARWLLLALEFTLAADVVRTAIAPSWDDIGHLAAIAAIRTFLNEFLERDMERMRQQVARARPAQPAGAGAEPA